MSTTAPEAPATAQPSPSLWPVVRAVLRPVASLRLTVALLALSVGLVFFGTLAQKTQGIWNVVDKYFWSMIVLIDAQPTVEFGKIFLGLPKDMQAPSWLLVPYPGGKLLGGLMFLNLLAAHLVRMKLSWKRSGVITLHLGILLLFVGEFITREFQVEQQMTITEGSSSNYAFDHRHAELAFVDTSDPKQDQVTVVSGRLLKRFAEQDKAFDNGQLPVGIQVVKWFPNSSLVPADKPGAANYADAGFGKEAIAVKKDEVSGVSQEKVVDLPSAYVRLFHKGTDHPIGTYLVSLLVDRPQKIDVDGKTYEMTLRFVHYYKPFSLHLEDFTFERYPGTDTPKNYASQLILDDPEAGQKRPVTVKMNEPLRYRGETFYQSSFTPDEKTTILQVVRNPGWVLPYAACVLVALGMTIHFGLNLGKFLTWMMTPRAQNAATEASLPPPPPRSAFVWAIPLGCVVLAAGYLASTVMPRSTGKFDLNAAARLPVLDGGRVKPLDTVARKDLRLITFREDFEEAGEKRSAIRWYLDAASGTPNDPGQAAKFPIFRIEHDQLWHLMGVPRRDGLRYSLEEMRDKFDALDDAAKKAMARPENDRDLFDAKVLELRKHLEIYLEVWQGQGRTAAAILPPGDGREWRTVGDVRKQAVAAARQEALQWAQANGLPQNLGNMNQQQQQQLLDVFEAAQQKAASADPGYAAWDAMMAAYRGGNAEEFNKKVAEFAALSSATVPAADLKRVQFETFLNGFAPFYRCAFLYGFAGLLTLAAWGTLTIDSGLWVGLRRAAFHILLLTFVVHTFGLFSRMYLMERPLVFVTNLYSSAIFIGWAAAGICLVVEKIFPIGLGNFVAAVIGVGTNIVAHNLALGGDTLEMMQAVLDTNFWLATHVTTVTLGYSATYVAALVGLSYVILGVFTPLLKNRVVLGPTSQGRPTDLGRVIAMVMYGILCLATLFSFVGTVLGGIWADQSWGRFWGWDPKENGAVLIVAWNALILHARWCGLVKDRGVAVLAVAGAIITTWSWFGTNQLGVGLHAYGFNNELVRLCDGIWIVCGLSMLLGLAPTQYWVSFAGLPTATPTEEARPRRR